MGYIRFIIVLLIVATSLQAEYIRSIRLGSFPNKASAQSALEAVNNFVAKNDEIVTLQKEHGFIFKSRPSGKYYITLAEPFTQRAVLQKVLNSLRKEYPTAYVTKLKSLPPKQVEEVSNKQHISENTIPKYVEEKGAESQETVLNQDMVSDAKDEIKPFLEEKTQEAPVAQEEPIQEQQLEETEYEVVNHPEEKVQEQQQEKELLVEDEEEEENEGFIKSENVLGEKEQSTHIEVFLLPGILVALFVVSIVLLWYFLKYKRANEKYINQEMIYKEKLEQANEDVVMKDKLLSYVSHELRTPMTAIMGLTHLVLENELTKVQKDYILKIENSSDHLLNLVNDILDASKLKAGELSLEEVEFNMNETLEYVMSVNAVSAKHNATQLFMNIADDIPSKVIGDSLRLGQVLINLIGNAVKFTKDGEVTLHVRRLSSVADIVKLEFDVVDTGIGMNEEEINNIFNSYKQASNSISREFGGTGLGLAISKELVEMMGGVIKVVSTKGEGTSFSFTVNLKVKDPENKRQYRLPLIFNAQ